MTEMIIWPSARYCRICPSSGSPTARTDAWMLGSPVSTARFGSSSGKNPTFFSTSTSDDGQEHAPINRPCQLRFQLQEHRVRGLSRHGSERPTGSPSPGRSLNFPRDTPEACTSAGELHHLAQQRLQLAALGDDGGGNHSREGRQSRCARSEAASPTSQMPSAAAAPSKAEPLCPTALPR